MAELGADVMITGSQKVLVCSSGVSVIVLSPRVLERVTKNDPKCMYLTLKTAVGYNEMSRTQYGDWMTPVKGTGNHGVLYYDTAHSYKDVLAEKFGYKREWFD